MKVLFAVSTENIVDSIIKVYQKKYKEIISSKNVYYYNAIIKELQRNQTYDRIVISEDLEPFTNNNYDAIDKFIFEKLDNISDEAIDSEGRDIPIIVICSERREKSDDLLVKLFSMGVYDALIGQDRKIEDVCKLLNKPRTKKEAKAYYRIEQGEYEHEDDNNVSEVEIQNILAHYRRIAKNEEKYVESFDSLAEQYSDEQLKIIIKFLPIEVKAVLESESNKYQSIMMYKSGTGTKRVSTQNNIENSNIKVEKIIDKNTKKMNGPIVIPSTVKKEGVKKFKFSNEVIEENEQDEENVESIRRERNIEVKRKPELRKLDFEEIDEPEVEEPEVEEPIIEDILEEDEVAVQEPLIDEPNEEDNFEEHIKLESNTEKTEEVLPVKRGRGRPRKIITEPIEDKPKRGRGRPRKNPQPEEMVQSNQEDYTAELLPGFEENERIKREQDNEETEEGSHTLPGFEEDNNDAEEILPGFEDENDDDEETLPGFEDENDDAEETLPSFEDENDDDEETLPGFEDENDDDEETLPSFEDDNENQDEKENAEDSNSDLKNYTRETYIKRPERRASYNDNIDGSIKPIINRSLQVSDEDEKRVDVSHLLTQDKKVVAFVGTSKNGVSFLVNNLGYILSEKGINTAIVDLTRNKNSYYIFTENKDDLREVAYNSMESLKNGKNEGIQVKRNLTVFTSSPNIRNSNYSIERMLTTLIKNYSLVLLDCDYTTSKEYFRAAQEIYLVQSMDVLTIQPLTEFLRRLKLNDILDISKLRAVINKAQRVRGLNENMIVGGMSTYNDPEMSIQDKLFDMKNIPTTVIPFDIYAYQSYLYQIATCEISTKGYSKMFLNNLNGLADQVYPLIYGSNNKRNKYYREDTQFTSNINDTLSKMKNYK